MEEIDRALDVIGLDNTVIYHCTSTYPSVNSEFDTDVSTMNVALEILKNIRGLRTERKVGNGAKLEMLTIPSDTPDVLHGMIKSAARANNIQLGDSLDFVVAQQNIAG